MTPRADGDDGMVFRATRMDELAALAAFIGRACARAGADAGAAADLRLAAEEVFTNIMRHGYGGRPGPVTVQVQVAPGRMVLSLADAAPDFDPAGVAAPETGAALEQREPGGLGWHLVRRVMDEVKREPGPGGGNVFTLVKELPAGRQAGSDE